LRFSVEHDLGGAGVVGCGRRAADLVRHLPVIHVVQIGHCKADDQLTTWLPTVSKVRVHGTTRRQIEEARA
jgi:hypothetical protein